MSVSILRHRFVSGRIDAPFQAEDGFLFKFRDHFPHLGIRFSRNVELSQWIIDESVDSETAWVKGERRAGSVIAAEEKRSTCETKTLSGPKTWMPSTAFASVCKY